MYMYMYHTTGTTEYKWMKECLDCERHHMRPWTIALISGGSVFAFLLSLLTCYKLSRRQKAKRQQKVTQEFEVGAKPGQTTV